MTSIKLGLVGKDIAHSQSEMIYKDLIRLPFEYHLLDIQNDKEISSAIQLFEEFDGISITSPYKKHFLNQVESDKHLPGINCLYRDGEIIKGANTDYLALKDLVDHYGFLKEKKIILLGNGVTSKCLQMVLQEKNIPFMLLTRKSHGNLNDFNFLELGAVSIINSCAREFNFQAKIPKDSSFWDLNYGIAAHDNKLGKKVEIYRNGIDLLKTQAQYSLKLWGLNN